MTFGAITADLNERLSHKSRKYHNVVHIGEFITEVNRLVRLTGRLDLASLARWVAWFHDADDDAESSALLALAMLSQTAMDPADIAEIVRGVRLTTDVHRVEPGDDLGALACDGDLWILSAPEERYDEYVRDVRKEYPQHADDVFRRGRMRIVYDFWQRARAGDLYHFGPQADRDIRHERAACNLSRELIGRAQRENNDRPVSSADMVAWYIDNHHAEIRFMMDLPI